MNIAVWNVPPADLFTTGFHSWEGTKRIDVQRMPGVDCTRALLEGRADAALLPTMAILERHDELDVVPAVALSTWRYPFARLVIDRGLGAPVRSVVYNPDFEQERFLAEVILREHYKIEPEFRPIPEAGLDRLTKAESDASLLVGADVATLPVEGQILDLGQEWFELANYPMTWGLFAARKDELDPPTLRTIRDAVLASERQRRIWVRAQETSTALHSFYMDDLRFRLDDLCVAGLTEFRQYLFYYDVVDDVREIPFVFLQDDEEESDDGMKPMV